MSNRIIKDQVLASTSSNVAGKPVPREVLEELFRQMPAQSQLHQHHDVSLQPVGRIYNRRLIEEENGVLTIVGDIEINDGVDVSQFGGFSISFTGAMLASPDCQPDVVLDLDMRFFRTEDFGRAVGVGPAGESIAVRELYRYSVTAILVAIPVTFASYEFAKGFFSAAGKDSYEFLKGKLSFLSSIQAKDGRKTTFDFGFEVHEGSHTYSVTVRAGEQDLEVLKCGLVSLDDLRNEVKSIFDPSKVQSISAKLATQPPYLRLLHGVPKHGLDPEFDLREPLSLDDCKGT